MRFSSFLRSSARLAAKPLFDGPVMRPVVRTRARSTALVSMTLCFLSRSSSFFSACRSWLILFLRAVGLALYPLPLHRLRLMPCSSSYIGRQFLSPSAQSYHHYSLSKHSAPAINCNHLIGNRPGATH